MHLFRYSKNIIKSSKKMINSLKKIIVSIISSKWSILVLSLFVLLTQWSPLMGMNRSMSFNPSSEQMTPATNEDPDDQEPFNENESELPGEMSPDPENPLGPAFEQEMMELFDQVEAPKKQTLIDPIELVNTHAINAKKYAHLDPKKLIPPKALKEALLFLDKYSLLLKNTEYMTIVDFTPHRFKNRLFLVSLFSGNVTEYVTTHGSGSDPNMDGYADRFSNTINSHMSSLGYYITQGTYISNRLGLSLRLKGMSSTNFNAYERAVLVHGAKYVYNPNRTSWGCFAITHELKKDLIRKIQNGSLLYAWADSKVITERHSKLIKK